MRFGLIDKGTAMGKVFLIATLLVLTACSSAARDAEEKFRFLQSKSAPAAELCEAASLARDEWAKEKNSAKYDELKLSAEMHCLSAETQKLILQ